MDNQTKARFFGMHIGCEFKHTCLSGTTENMGCYQELDEQTAKSHYRIRDVFNKWYSLDLAQLILRPLSSITDEEAIEVGKMLGYTITETRPKFVAKSKGRSFCEFLESGELMRCGIAVFEIHDYLRSIGICLPFMGIDPVAEGWAVLKEH